MFSSSLGGDKGQGRGRGASRLDREWWCDGATVAETFMHTHIPSLSHILILSLFPP